VEVEISVRGVHNILHKDLNLWQHLVPKLKVKNYLTNYNVTAFEHPSYSSDLSPSDFFLFPLLKRFLKGQRFASAEEVTANATRALTGIEKLLPGMLPKALRILTKVCYCSREPLRRKFCVDRRTVTYSCAINQFWKLFKCTLVSGNGSVITAPWQRIRTQ
jgi:hypothetical protein